MPIAIANKSDKDEAIELLRKVLQAYLFQGLSEKQKEDILTHLLWMRNRSGTLNIECKLEAIPELELTKVDLRIFFGDRMPNEKRN